MSTPRFASVDDYIASVDATKRKTLEALIDFILTEFPDLESKIAWNVPTIHWGGKYVVGVAALKKHLTFSVFSPRIIADNKERLEVDYKVLKNCFQIPVDWEIDRELVKDLVGARLVELETTPGKI